MYSRSMTVLVSKFVGSEGVDPNQWRDKVCVTLHVRKVTSRPCTDVVSTASRIGTGPRSFVMLSKG